MILKIIITIICITIGFFYELFNFIILLFNSFSLKIVLLYC
jgi:hypothetical protein